MDLMFDGCPSEEALKEAEENLKGITSVKPVQHRLAELFVLLFRENFMDTPHQLWQGASKSNWTYHTAFEIRETAQVLNLNCIFETAGKLDALIQTIEEKPRAVIFAEWESDYRSVFGEGKELDKLWKGLGRKKDVHALLLTYCLEDKYYNFLKDVIEYWRSRAEKVKRAPSLFLLVAVYRVENSTEQISVLRTTEILPDEVKLWDDLSF